MSQIGIRGVTMTKSDKVRMYCNDTIIIPARTKGEKRVRIRAGDIQDQMNIKNRTPIICSALQTLKFEKFANVKRISIEGPGAGTNCIMTFGIL